MIPLLNCGILLGIPVQECEVVTASKMLAEIARERGALHAVLHRARCQGSNSLSRILGICPKYLQNGRTEAPPQKEISLQRYRQEDRRYAPAQPQLKALTNIGQHFTRMRANIRSDANPLRPPTHSVNQHSIYL